MTHSISVALVCVVAALHVLIAAVEIFWWNLAKVHERLDFNSEEARKVAPIVANVGLYNGFVAVGLIWSLFIQDDGRTTTLFFLTFVAIAGLFGALSLRRPAVLFLQTAPALLAILSSLVLH